MTSVAATNALGRIGRAGWVHATPYRGGVAALAAVVGIGAAAVVLTSEHADSRAWTAGFVLFVGWSFVVSGMVAWARRPTNGVCRLMVLTGFASFLSALSAANSSVPFTVGVALGGAGLAVLAHLLLAFPSGRLGGRLERALAGALYVDLVGLEVVRLLFADLDRTGCQDCVSGGLHEPAALARNALLVHRSDGTADALEAVQNGVGVALAVAVTAILVRRWRRASAPARRALAPVLVTGAAAVVLFLLVLLTFLVWEGAAPPLRWVALLAYGSVPIAFLVGLLRSRLARVPAARLLLEMPESASLPDVEDVLRRASGDPTLELLHWLDDERHYIRAGGEPVALPVVRPGRAVTPIESEGRPLAALVHDPSLGAEPELLEEVVAGVRMTLERDRGLRALRASEARNRALVKALPDLLLQISGEGRYLAVKAAVDGSLPVIPANELVGRTVADVLAPDAAELFMRAVRSALLSGGTATVEYQLELRGERRDFEARIVPSGSDEVVAVVRDFTELRRLQEELHAKLSELEASRARLVEVETAERRRLERNLHDGAQQRLLATSLMLRVAGSRLDTEDVPAARTLLSQSSDELAAALEELRELARGIHPVILTDRGLRAALEGVASRAPVPVELAVPDERLPDRVEEAAYYLVSEALTNIGRYARASSVKVSVACKDGDARVTVSDDGVGGADPGRGSGLRGLRDRVEALSGRLDISSPPGGGTTLTAVIPCG